jgi:hypothetical protein
MDDRDQYTKTREGLIAAVILVGLLYLLQAGVEGLVGMTLEVMKRR